MVDHTAAAARHLTELQGSNDHFWYYLTLFLGVLLAGASFIQYREAELQQRYQRQKAEARQRMMASKKQEKKD
jgi:hypothetical protein